MERTYSRNDDSLFLTDGSSERYVLTVRDLPDDQRPREKLQALGPAGISVQELLAILLNAGTVKENVLSMSKRIITEYGEGGLRMAKDPKVLADDLGIPLGKAMQVVACAELGRRFFCRNRNGASVLRTPQDVFEYVRDIQNLPKEHLKGIYLDTHYQVVHDETLSIGTIGANLIHPREVFRPAIAHAAAAVILVHNHPSGIATPSQSDVAVTLQIVEAGHVLGIDLIDHLIVTNKEFSSIPLV